MISKKRRYFKSIFQGSLRNVNYLEIIVQGPNKTWIILRIFFKNQIKRGFKKKISGISKFFDYLKNNFRGPPKVLI